MTELGQTEIAVLSACIQSPVARAEAKRRIVGADFFHPLHEKVWDAVLRLERHGKDVGWVTVRHVLAGDQTALRLIPELVTCPVVPEHIADYADIVRDQAVKRRLLNEARRLTQMAEKDGVSGHGLAAATATRFAAIRDAGISDADMRAITLGELMAMPEEPYDWVIPDLLERSDRLILTGEEGLGKSFLLRQIAVYAAAGLHPFRHEQIPPVKSLLIDCENSQRQIRRSVGPVLSFASMAGENPADRVTVECPGRMNLTADRDLARVHHLLDAIQPDIVVIGPLYRLVPRALQTDDEAAPLLTALDSIRDRGIVLLIEAHAGHTLGKHGTRDLRPRGSSALLGWPEFGYGMRGTSDTTCDLSRWRGNRDARAWPKALERHAASSRWLPVQDTWTPTGALA